MEDEEVLIEPPAEAPAAEEPPAELTEEEKRWQSLSAVSAQMGELLNEVRTSNQRASDQAATVSQLLATNQELTRQLQENNRLMLTPAPSTDPDPIPPPSEEPNPPKPNEPSNNESDEPPEIKNEPPPEPAPPERVQRRRRSI